MPDVSDVPGSIRLANHIVVAIAEFSTGGSERIAIRLANFWAAAGRQVTIVCGSADGPTRALVAPNVAVIVVGKREEVSRSLLGRDMAAAIATLGGDVIVGPGNYHVPLLHSLTKVWPEHPPIVCKISNPLLRADRSRLRRAIFLAGFRRQSRRFACMVAMSPMLAAEARGVLPHRNIACVPEPILDSAALPPRRARSSGLIMCIGRLAGQKNLMLALEAFARLSTDARLIFLGEGEDYDALSERAAVLGISDRIRFAGFVADVRPWLGQADALLLTSRFEGYPAVLIEALAARVPVVTTDCSKALDDIMLDPSFGTIVPADADALAMALQRTLEEGRRPRAAPLAKVLRRHYGPHAAMRWLAVLDEVVSEGRVSGFPLEWSGDADEAAAAPIAPAEPASAEPVAVL